MQCAISIFDGLLPEPHNTHVLKLLFELAHWHGLAKLCMHTDVTLDLLSLATASLGNSLCVFEEKTCAAFETQELEHERAAWQRHQEKSATNVMSASRGSTAPSGHAWKQKKLNLRTYKYHALGDYIDTIQRIGTTDSYSTQLVSFCMMLGLLLTAGLRASLSTKHPKPGHFRPAADQYRSKYQGLSDKSAISA